MSLTEGTIYELCIDVNYRCFKHSDAAEARIREFRDAFNKEFSPHLIRAKLRVSSVHDEMASSEQQMSMLKEWLTKEQQQQFYAAHHRPTLLDDLA